MSTQLYDVAIVGFGPAGATAAALLGQAGLRVWVADRLPDVYEIPRAIALDHEIMRVFQQLGVLEDVEPHCEPFTPSEYYGVDGQLIRRMTMVPPPYPQGHVPSLVFTQPPVERALRAKVAAMDRVDVALSTTVSGIQPGQDDVVLAVSDAQGHASQVRARWVIACDGGSSGVRDALGISLVDLDFDEPWLVVDVRVNAQGLAKLPRTSVQYCEPQRPCTYVIGPGNHRRWEISLKPGEDAQQAATPEATWALLSRWLTPEDGTLWRQSSYRFHALVAERWRQGRVFVAGDAAHMQPPFLGQGMCQGVRDVANLSWKLISVIRGEVGGPAAERLLDSYGEERSAHVRELTTRIKAVGAVICERDVDLARARDTRLLAESGDVVKDTPRQDVLPRLEPGLLAEADSTARGTLGPQPWLIDATGWRKRMDDVHGTGWRLLLAADAADLAEAVDLAAWPGLQCIRLATRPSACTAAMPWADADGVLSAWFDRHRCRAALLRPDNHVFGSTADAAGLAELLAQVREALH